MNKESNKMIRFLNSIGIDNVEDFDMSFDICERHPIKKDLLIIIDPPIQFSRILL